MTLRLMLVGLVTGLGLELPSGRDLSCWADSGRAWVVAQVSDLSEEPVAVVPAVEPDADLAFRAASEGIAADFASDRSASLASAMIAAADSDAMIAAADADAPASVDLPEGEEVASSLVPAVEVNAAEAAEADDEPVDAVTPEDDEAPSRSDRLSSAVRMTRDAVRAWSGLIRESADEAGLAR